MRLRKSLGPAAIETAAGGYRLALDRRRPRHPALRGAGRAGAGAGRDGRARAGGLHARARAGAVAGRTVRGSRRLGAGPQRGRPPRGAAPQRRGGPARGPARRRRAPRGRRRRRGAGRARSRCGSGAGPSWRWPSTAAAARPTRCGRCSGRGARWSTSSASTPAPSWSRWRPRSCARTPTWRRRRSRRRSREQCPYKGLAPYDVGDARPLLRPRRRGRRLPGAAAASPLLVVAGPSGCGKSSLVRRGRGSGAAARGASGGRVRARCGSRRGLDERASHRRPATPVVVVDQFEELFTLDDDADVARPSAPPGRRTPPSGRRWWSRCAPTTSPASPPTRLRPLAEQGLHLVSPLAGDALREAIEGPRRTGRAPPRTRPGRPAGARHRGRARRAAAAVARAGRDVAAPRRRVLTVEGYRATGGIRGAVARSADRLYESLPPDQRGTAALGPAAPGRARRSTASRSAAGSPAGTLGGDPARERIVGLLVRARLVTAEEDTVELAHEALARAWPRLQSWLDEDAAGQRILRHLAAAADGWESLGRPDSELYRGARLEAALEWRDAAQPDLTAVEAAFLDASVARAASERAALAQRGRHHARQNRRLRGLLVGAAVLLVVALRRRRSSRSQRPDSDAPRRAARRAPRSRRWSTGRWPCGRPTAPSPRCSPSRPTGARPTTLGPTRRCSARSPAAPGFLGYQLPPGRRTSSTARSSRAPPRAVVALDGRDLAARRPRRPASSTTASRPPTSLSPPRPTAVAAARQRRRPLRRPADRPPTVASRASIRERLRATDDRARASRSPCTTSPRGRRVLGPITPSVRPRRRRHQRRRLARRRRRRLRRRRRRLPHRRRRAARHRAPASPAPSPSRRSLRRRDTAAVAFGPDGTLYLGSLPGPIRVVDPATLQVVRTVDAPLLSSHLNLVVTPDGLLVGSGAQAHRRGRPATGADRWRQTSSTASLSRCRAVARRRAGGRAALLRRTPSGVIDERDLATGQRRPA